MMRKICNVLLILVSVICFNVNIEASTISGKVLDVEGNGIANAIVQVEGQNSKK